MSKTNINLRNGKLKKKSKSVSDRILFSVIIILLVAVTVFLAVTLLWGVDHLFKKRAGLSEKYVRFS